MTENRKATPPSPSAAPEELRNVFDLAWKQALDDAAFYVAGHCADGEHHVEHIRELVPPKLRVLGVEVASRPAEVDDWISVDERLPGKGHCLAAYVNAAGRHRVIRAMYVGQFQIDASEDAIDQGSCEYHEADDTFYLKAGWLECIDNWDDYSSIYVTEGIVTHWRNLPAAPSHTTSEDVD